MKITEFLKRYSLINSKFIDDFYSFYDEGKNEYDYTIDLEKLALWLEVRKDSLKELLSANFTNLIYIPINPFSKNAHLKCTFWYVR
jgi:hypothetical protein